MKEYKKILFELEECENLELKCGTCTKYLSVPPIFHSTVKGYVCGRCYQKVLVDNENHSSFERQILFESLAKYVVFRCSYSTLGCCKELSWSDVTLHETVCPFRNSVCPLSERNKGLLSIKQTCDWRSCSQQLHSHLVSDHPDKFMNPPSIVLDLQAELKTNFFFTEVLKQVMMIIIKYNEDKDKFEFRVLANLSDIECDFFRFQVEICDDANTKSLVLRKNNVEPLCDIFKDDISQDNLEIDIKTIYSTFENVSSFLIRMGIVKKNKKEIKILKSKLPPDSILNSPTHERCPKIDEDTLQELECPVCKEYMIPPIFLCKAGHSICNSCFKKVTLCPSCRSAMLETRNFTLEKLTNLVGYPCKNRLSGCFFVSSPGKIRMHENGCDLNESNCILRCPWIGNTLDMIIHLSKEHSILELNKAKTLFLSPNKMTIKEAIIYSNNIFLLKLSFGFKHSFQYCLRLLGSDPAKFKYKLQILDMTGNGFDIILNHKCSLHAIESLKNDDTKRKYSDISLPFNLIQPLILNAKEINYKLNISQIDCI